MAARKEREYLTAISVVGGLITLIEPNGEIGYYRQRGIQKLDSYTIQALVAAGRLDSQWGAYKELPANYSISFEDAEIMGRALATFNPRR